MKNQIHLIILPLAFLVFLYSSPSGITLYWAATQLFLLLLHLFSRIIHAPHIFLMRKTPIMRYAPQPSFFLICTAFLAILTGLLIPSTLIASSPHDFIITSADPNPVWYVINATILALGTFVLWPGTYYFTGSTYTRHIMELLCWTLIPVFLVNYLFFRNNLGTLSSTLRFDTPPEFSIIQKLINIAILLLTCSFAILILIKKKMLAKSIAITLSFAMVVVSFINLYTTQSAVSQALKARERNYRGKVEIPLCKEGQNIVVLMLDRAISSYIPCMMYEKPELQDVFSGFVYYPNTLSHGSHTVFGAPGLFGGYEYTPRAQNLRNQETLRNKYNEALLLMPTLFSRANHRVSIFDVPFPGNYTFTGDYSVFDSLNNTNARKLSGSIELSGNWEKVENLRLRNFFCYSLCMTAPTVFFSSLYNMAYYNRPRGSASLFSLNGKMSSFVEAEQSAKWISEFIMEYEVLSCLPRITTIEESSQNTFLLMANNLTHDQVINLSEPDYQPGPIPNNAIYDEMHQDRFSAGPIQITIKTEAQLAHYQTNMAAILLLGDWLEYLKEMGVYDNTRIIIVSDHGSRLEQIDGSLMQTNQPSYGESDILLDSQEDIMAYNPLLLVKDFNSEGKIRTDTSFMTNADVPAIALAGLTIDLINPFTGRLINSEAKKEPQDVTISHWYNPRSTTETTFLPAGWYQVSPGGKTLFDTNRWTLLPEIN